jgi:hypothetical protein
MNAPPMTHEKPSVAHNPHGRAGAVWLADSPQRVCMKVVGGWNSGANADLSGH